MNSYPTGLNIFFVYIILSMIEFMTEELSTSGKNNLQGAGAEKRSNPLTSFIHDNSRVKKSQDDELIDIHIGNPLRKIIS